MQISSTNNKIVVVGDVHQDIRTLEKIIKHEAPDLVVCVGDWWDSHYYDALNFVENTNTFLKENLITTSLITCVGNHDLHYLHDNPHTICSGYDPDKRVLIKAMWGRNFNHIRRQFRWHVWIDDHLVTHAGVHVSHMPAFLNADLDKKDVDAWLTKAGEHASINLITKHSHWMYRAGEARMQDPSSASQKFGGITWLDFNREFEPIPGLKQIFGHTRQDKIYYDTPLLSPVKYVPADNFNIDCGLSQYLVMNNQQIEIRSTKDI